MGKRLTVITTAAMLAAIPAPALAAGATDFVLANGTGANLSAVSVRRHGTQDWRPLGVAPAAGARGKAAFSDPDCAFDIRADVAGASSTVWSGVNLCEVSVVTLVRNASGAVWVEYD